MGELNTFGNWKLLAIGGLRKMKWKDSPDKLWLSLRHIGLKTDYMTDTKETSSVVCRVCTLCILSPIDATCRYRNMNQSSFLWLFERLVGERITKVLVFYSYFIQIGNSDTSDDACLLKNRRDIIWLRQVPRVSRHTSYVRNTYAI